MRKPFLLMSLSASLLAPGTYAGEDGLCRIMDTFIQSVQPDTEKSVEFQTAWGHNFRGATEEAIFAKRCIHQGDKYAMNVCRYFMEHGVTEFAGTNFKNALQCLSSKTKIDASVQFEEATVSMSYGSDERGALIDLSLKSDSEIDGMVLTIDVQGY